MRPIIASLAIAFSLITATAQAETFTVDPAASPVEFKATGKPGFLKITGQKARLSGEARRDAGSFSGEFHVDLTALKTGMDLRDEHMRDRYLEVGKFPTATLKLIAQKFALDGSEATIDGLLTIKGQEHPVKVLATLQESDGHVTGDASFKIKLSDYPVGVPSYLGVTVAADVEVLVKIAAATKPGA